jgi:hypothetical protein
MTVCENSAVTEEVMNYVGPLQAETPEKRRLQAAMARSMLYGMYACSALSKQDLIRIGDELANWYMGDHHHE